MGYLAAPDSRVVFGRGQENKEMRKQEMAHLVMLDIVRGEPDRELKGDHNAIYNYLT